MNLPDLENRLLVDLRNSALTLVAHDAGGANVLTSFVKNFNLKANRLELAGPATEILNGYRPGRQKKGLSEPEIILASTGWSSNFEKNHISQSIQRGLRTIVCLDHWTNFGQRLQSEEGPIPILEIITFDEEARSLATRTFPDSQVYQFPNYYLINQCEKINQLRHLHSELKYDFLFVGEPIRDRKYSELDALTKFLTQVGRHNEANLKIALRPHPSQSIDYYRKMIMYFQNPQIKITEGSSLAEDLSHSKAVVGCNSMALHLASLCQIPTFCAVPEPFESELPAQVFSDWEIYE